MICVPLDFIRFMGLQKVLPPEPLATDASDPQAHKKGKELSSYSIAGASLIPISGQILIMIALPG